MTGYNCYQDTLEIVQEFVAANITKNALAATALNWFFLCAAFYGLFKLTMFFLQHVLSVLSSFKPRGSLKKMGSWAVVTGATDGIGKAMAFELARQVCCVCVVCVCVCVCVCMFAACRLCVRAPCACFAACGWLLVIGLWY